MTGDGSKPVKPDGSGFLRGPGGRFANGNRGGPGNPDLKRTAEVRRWVREATTEEDIKEVVSALIDSAKGGEVPAARELFDRLVGRPRQMPESITLDLDVDMAEVTAASLSEVSASILRAVARGEIGVEQAVQLGGLVGVAQRNLELVQMEDRLARLEVALAEGSRR